MGIGFLAGVLGSCIWVYFIFFSGGFASVVCQEAFGDDGFADGVAYVDGKFAIGYTDEDFICATIDWWPPEKCDYGTCSWGLASILNLDLSNPILINAVREFSPIKLRIGGSLQDKVIYGVDDPEIKCVPFEKNGSQMFGFTEGCLSMSRWDELNKFFQKTGAIVTFGLNALNGRIHLKDGSSKGPWDSKNAAAFIKYTVNKGYTVHGWELGNELSGHGTGTRVESTQYANDVIKLKSIVDNIYGDSLSKPLVLSPGGFFDATWFKYLVEKTKPNSMDAITHHIYNLGPGVDTHLVSKILDPSFLNGEAKTFRDLQEILINAETSTTAWVGEAGGAYNSGQNHSAVNVPKLPKGLSISPSGFIENVSGKRGDTKDHPLSQWYLNFSEADELLKLAAARQQVQGERRRMMRSSASSVTSSSSISTASAFTSSSSSTSSPSPTSPCAACKFLRRKCHPDCVFAPYFPPDNPQKFAHVHKVFGASNVTKLLNELSPYQREDAVNSLAYEADMRLRDPIYGCVGVISILEHQLRQLQIDLARAKYELSKYQTAAASGGAAGVDFFGLGRNNYEPEMGGNFGFQFQKPSTTTGVLDEKQTVRPPLN